ncbi:MAG: hypothetical protein ACRD6X_21765 [Pyrinomonadaceae bacterium]
MSSTFETVLEQANALSAADRKRLALILGKKNGKSVQINEEWDDDPIIVELRSKVDEIEKSENPKRDSSAKIAERIRKWNDRGYEL